MNSVDANQVLKIFNLVNISGHKGQLSDANVIN
jgi:hypothetical protein